MARRRSKIGRPCGKRGSGKVWIRRRTRTGKYLTYCGKRRKS